MSRLLILGAGVYQVPLILRACERGHHVAVASWSGDDPGMRLAHDAWVVDTTDKETLLERARAANIEGVTTTGTDIAVPSIGHICDAMGLPGFCYETSLTCSNKLRMQSAFAENGVRSAQHRQVNSLAAAREAAEHIGYPVIVKAPDSSGSRGITSVETEDALAAAFDEAMRVARCGSVLVEERLTGEEFGAQIVVREGEVQACLFHNDTVTPPPISVPIGHSCPERLNAATRVDAEAVCRAAVDALGIRNAVCNADLIVTERGVYMLEIGVRIGATGIPEILALHAGVDLYDAALNLALGRPPDVRPRPGKAAAILIVRAPATGVLRRCRVPDQVRDFAPDGTVAFDYEEGAHVRAFRTGPDRIGSIIVTADTADGAEALCERIADGLDVVVDAARE